MMEEDIIVTLEGDDFDDGAEDIGVEDMNNMVNGAHSLNIPKAPNSAGTLSAGEDDQFSSSPGTGAVYSSEDDDESGSGISRGRGSGISSSSLSMGRKPSLPEVEPRIFESEEEHKAYKRMKALEEILDTERAYVKSLDILNKVRQSIFGFLKKASCLF